MNVRRKMTRIGHGWAEIWPHKAGQYFFGFTKETALWTPSKVPRSAKYWPRVVEVLFSETPQSLARHRTKDDRNRTRLAWATRFSLRLPACRLPQRSLERPARISTENIVTQANCGQFWSFFVLRPSILYRASENIIRAVFSLWLKYWRPMEWDKKSKKWSEPQIIPPSFVGSYLGSTVSNSGHLSSCVHIWTYYRSIDTIMVSLHIRMLPIHVVKVGENFPLFFLFPFFSTNSKANLDIKPY